MAINNDRNLLEQQILSNSGLKGKELENLRARLATLSEQQLQAELSKSLSGNNKREWYTGVMLEHNESVIMRNNHDQTSYTDDNGNEISELKDGDEVLERTIKSTDDKGNVFETTVTYSGGRPLTQTKTKNGNTTETTTYKYNDDADVPFVTVETKKADQSKVMTNVLEIDENGNFDNEDFIDRQTTSMDGITTHIFTENNCVIEQQVKPNGKKIDTIYKGDSIEGYDNKKLHRVYQRTELKGEIHEVAYDGNGNTRTVVQNGESPSAIAKKFGVKESSLRRLNPARGKNAITQVGADIVVPGEYDADARVMTRRKGKLGAMQDFANDEVQRTAQRLYSSTMQEVTLDKDYKDAYSYARALLAADGVKNPSNQQVNNKANEILVANGNIKFKKGTKVQITAKAPDSKFVQDLSNNGFKPTRENAIFYNRFNALNPTQQQNVLSVIKYCRSQKITDPNKIKARILETFPEINLFDSGKVIPMNSSFGTPAFQRKNPVALETFLTETLKLDLKSDVGRQVYERLASLPQDELNKINAQNFSDMSKANFNDIANHLETSGVNIRTQMENQIEQANRDHRAEMLGIPQQKFTSEMLANIYDRAADMMEEYYHNHGVLDAGTYLEGMKNIMDWITPDNLFGIDMRSTLHVASDCRKAAQRFRQMHTDNPETFKREYAQLKKDGLVTADYNQQNVQEFMNLIQSGDVDINSDKFKNACKKAFGFKGVENTEKYIQTGQMAGNIGDIAVMLYTLGAASELKMMGKATQGVYGALERGAGRIMSKTAAQRTAKIGTSMAMGGTTLGGFTLGKETLNNLSNPMRDATNWETWKETGIASAESFGFGAFGGLLNETVVAPIVKAIEKPATKATQAVSKALTGQGELTGKQIMQTVSESGGLKLDGLFKMNSQELANFARTATAKGVGFGAEVSGFTAYEAGLDIIKDLIDPQTGRLPDNIDVKYLCDKFGEQLSNLGTIKGVSMFLMMRKGGKLAQKAMMNKFLSESEALKNIKFKKAEINGHEVYEVTYPNGNRAVVSSPEQAIATCQMAMQMEFLARSLSEVETGSAKPQTRTQITKPEGEVKALEVKPEGAEENPLLTRLETANDRESFVAIRDEIKKMPNGEQKTQMMQAYLKKYNEWSADPSRPDIRMQYMPEKENAGNTQTDIYNLKSIDGYIDENTQVSEQTRNNITTLLNNSVNDPMIADILLENIPNEHCAKVLEAYINKYAGSKDLSRLPLGLDGAESVKAFTKLLENTTNEIKPFQVMNIERYGFDKYLELEQNGYLPPAIRGFDSEGLKSIDKIEDPVVRHRLHKLYASKLFSRNDFYKLYQIRNKEIDFNKLDRLDSMCDDLQVFDEMSIGHCERLLELSDEQIDIIEKRGLLKRIPNRENKLTGSDVFELLEVDDATWNKIQERNLLADIPERENKYAKSLSADDAILYSELTDVEWQRIKDMGLLYKEYDNNHNSHSIYATGDKYSSAKTNIMMAKMNDSQKEAFDRFQKMVKSNDGQTPLFDTDESSQLALLPDAKREFIEKVMNMQTAEGKRFFDDGYQICHLADLSDEQIAKAQQRGLFNVMTVNRYGSEQPAIFNAYAIEKLSSLSDATWQRLENLGLEGTKKYEGYQVLAEFTPEEWNKLPENVQDVDNFNTLSAAIKMDDKAWNRYKSDFMKKLDLYTDEFSIKKILQLEDSQYAKLQELAKRDDRGKTALSMKLSTQDLLSLSSLDDKAFERVKNDLFHIEGFLQELPVDNMIKLAGLDDVKYKFFVDNYLSVAAEQNILENINFDHAYKFTHYLAGKNLNYSKEDIFKLMNAPLRDETVMFAVKMCTDSDMKIPFTTQTYQTRKLGENGLVLDILKVLENTTEAYAYPETVETLLKDTDIKNNPLLVNALPKLVGFISNENYSQVKELFTNLAKDKNLTYEALDSILSKFYGSSWTGAISKAERPEKISLALELVKDPDFPNEMIASSITNNRFDYDAHKEYAPQSDFADKVRKVREFRDAILNDPNLVKDGGYSSLEIAQDEIKTRFYNCFSSYMKYFDMAESMLVKENPPSKFNVMEIMQATWEGNEAVSRKLCAEYDKIGLDPKQITSILHNINNENQADALKLLENYKNMEIAPSQITVLLDFDNNVSYKQIQALNKKMGRHKAGALEHKDLLVACKFPDLYGVKNINEIPISGKKELLHNLVSSNTGLFEISDNMSKDFPLIPRNQEEYCSLLPSIVRSLGIETNELTPEQRITMFNSSMGELSKSVAEISDADFAKMTITQEYPKDKFILDVLDKVKALPRTERQKVYDYFGFELHHNKENSTGFSITGYPVNLNNGKKLAQIEDSRTKAVVEDLRPNVIRFSENNKIKCNNPQVERFLNEVIEALPELRTTIGKKQHGNGENYGHDFDIMQHSLKVMQKVAQDPKFETLNESDQKIMLLASLMHDITKSEGRVDKTHANYGSFDSFFIAQKFNLSKEEEVKLHTVIKQHEWLEYVNSAKSAEQLTKRLQSVAYDLHQGNLFDMAEIFTHADLKAVKVDDSFHDTTEGKSRIGFDGSVRSFGESANVYAQRIRGYIRELQKSQPLLPQTKVPRASKINEAITQVNPDGSTNIKGVYKDKDGLVVIKFNEVEDWEAIGFPKGSISHGVEIKKGEKGDAELSEDVNTGNIKFFVHALEYSNQLAKFDAFSLVDSDALLSVSYAERPESKYRFFRSQGVLLDVNSKYIHGGGNHDSGSGYGKDINEFKNNYIFGGRRQKERTYVSDLIKEVTGMTDEQYVEFVETNKDRPIQEIEPIEIRDKIIKAFATINSNTRKGKREYNEMYISNPNEVMGVFAYNINYNENIENPVEFLNRTTIGKYERGAGANGKDIPVRERTEFLRQYALERDLPFIIFGD